MISLILAIFTKQLKVKKIKAKTIEKILFIILFFLFNNGLAGVSAGAHNNMANIQNK